MIFFLLPEGAEVIESEEVMTSSWQGSQATDGLHSAAHRNEHRQRRHRTSEEVVAEHKCHSFIASPAQFFFIAWANF